MHFFQDHASFLVVMCLSNYVRFHEKITSHNYVLHDAKHLTANQWTAFPPRGTTAAGEK